VSWVYRASPPASSSLPNLAGRKLPAWGIERLSEPCAVPTHSPAASCSPSIIDGKVIQPQRELPVLHQTDVLVVGGGPAGVTAAIAAKRTGANVTLVERYGHFGGLWTGGLVLLVIGHIVKGGKQVCQGIARR